MRPEGQADQLVREEAHPILPERVEPIRESIDGTRLGLSWTLAASVHHEYGRLTLAAAGLLYMFRISLCLDLSVFIFTFFTNGST